ncbi:hypothetical protein AVEN_134902-1 [Araneus ventricosus]|uniref:Uncharacterized protein n=1 Tax=Araneus ventricosus TaxID=182803 RepID=A0A4Y2CH62_ARAVE|nr:hypothetical protein AVEN_134902-1 [Araneus ventricosus]
MGEKRHNPRHLSLKFLNISDSFVPLSDAVQKGRERKMSRSSKQERGDKKPQPNHAPLKDSRMSNLGAQSKAKLLLLFREFTFALHLRVPVQMPQIMDPSIVPPLVDKNLKCRF